MIKKIAKAAACLLVAMPISGMAQSQSVYQLTPQDYIDIENLVNAYPDKIDGCTNSGYDYADQYVPDAVFGVSSEWGDEGKIWYRGREELAEAAGGGKGGCKPRPTGPSKYHHISTSQVTTPTATGASGRSTLLLLGSGTAENPPQIEWQGGYEDTYVKTPQGWRFKSRLHVWPGYDWPNTAAEMSARRAKKTP